MASRRADTKDRDQHLWRDLVGKLGEDWRGSPVYRLKLNGSSPDRLTLFPKDLRAGDPIRGRLLLSGVWTFGQETMKLETGETPWDRVVPSRHFADRLHRFHWLRDICAVETDGFRHARAMLDSWTGEFGKWNGFVWRPNVTVDRLWNWVVSGEQLLDSHAPDSVVLDTIFRQLRHVQSSVNDYPDASVRLRAAALRLMMCFVTDEGEKRIVDQESALEAALGIHILADGGHASRSPHQMLDALLDLQTVQAVYVSSGRTVFPALDKAMTRIGGMLGFLRLGDARLPIFNGSREAKRQDVETAFAPYASSRLFSFATKSGFQRLSSGVMTLVLDAGAAPESLHGASAHSGCLGFDLTDGDSRIITSCGSHPDLAPDWRDSARATAAHSTLSIDGENSGEFSQNRETGTFQPHGPNAVTAKRMEERNQILIDAQHGGWRERYGLVHRRRLYLSGDGTRLTGEDSLSRPISEGQSETTQPIPFELRFHLHPDVQLFEHEDKIGLRLSNGNEWVFKTQHKDRSIERSVYLARGKVEKSWQLVMKGNADPNGDGSTAPNRVIWALTRLEAG